MPVRELFADDGPILRAKFMAVVDCVQVRSQALLQDKYQHICAGFAGHVTDIMATLTQIVSAAAAAAAAAAPPTTDFNCLSSA